MCAAGTLLRLRYSMWREIFLIGTQKSMIRQKLNEKIKLLVLNRKSARHIH